MIIDHLNPKEIKNESNNDNSFKRNRQYARGWPKRGWKSKYNRNQKRKKIVKIRRNNLRIRKKIPQHRESKTGQTPKDQRIKSETERLREITILSIDEIRQGNSWESEKEMMNGSKGKCPNLRKRGNQWC